MKPVCSCSYTVFAGVRKESDATSLKQAATGDLRPLLLDVTNVEHIRDAVRTVTESKVPLIAIGARSVAASA
mgnify:CR=1 FL=1